MSPLNKDDMGGENLLKPVIQEAIGVTMKERKEQQKES